MTTLQALSGAGYPGVASLDAVGNVVPFISGEEAKIESEPKKILGSLERGQVVPHPVVLSASTTRVAVVNGHTESIAVQLEQHPSLDEVRHALVSFSGAPQRHRLPSAPGQPIVYLHEENRPQPRLDVDRDGGMTVTVGRLRTCPILGYKFFALGTQHRARGGGSGGVERRVAGGRRRARLAGRAGVR